MSECSIDTQERLQILAIALPTSLLSLAFACAILLYFNRRRIVTRLYHKYNGPIDRGSGENRPDTKHWSEVAFPSETNSRPSCVLPDVDISPSNKPDPYHPVTRQEPSRTFGTPNFPGPRQLLAGRQNSVERLHSSEKSFVGYRPRCATPDTPLSRKDQLAYRARLIQDTHVRLGSISPEPPLHESPQAVADALRDCDGCETQTNGTDAGEQQVKPTKARPRSFSRPLSKSSRPTSPYARPISPTGSIRLVDRGSKDMEVARRCMSDAMGTRLDEVFVPEWEPVVDETRWVTK